MEAWCLDATWTGLYSYVINTLCMGHGLDPPRIARNHSVDRIVDKYNACTAYMVDTIYYGSDLRRAVFPLEASNPCPS